MQKARVLVFTNSFRSGGSERQAVELAKRLDGDRFDTRIACFQEDGWLLQELSGPLAKVEEFRLSGFFNARAFRQAGAFLKSLRRRRVHVVQSFDFYSNLFAIPLAWLAGVPVILGSRREDSMLKTRAQRIAERWCYRLATGVVTNAEATKEHLLVRDKLPPERIWVIHNGLDLERFDKRSGTGKASRTRSGGMTIAVIALFRPEKGHMVFLDAIRRVITRYPDTKVLLVGDGPCREQIDRRIWELRLTDHVKLTGQVQNIPALLKTVDAVALPSLRESFPNAVMEAMAASVPVVASDTGGVRELLVDGHSGYIVPPGDAAALADRLEALCEDADLRRKMGEAGRRRIAADFTMQKMAGDFERLYQSLLLIAGTTIGM